MFFWKSENNVEHFKLRTRILDSLRQNKNEVMAFAIRLHLHFLLFSKDSNEIIITDLFYSLVSTGAIIITVNDRGRNQKL